MTKLLMRFKYIAVLLALVTGYANAQSTVVSGSLVDSSGYTWSYGTVTAVFQRAPNSSGTPVWSGGTLNPIPASVATDSGGNFSITLPTNTYITPAGSTWLFSFCPNATTQCAVINIPLTTSTFNPVSTITAQGAWPTGQIFPTQISKVYNVAQAGTPPLNQGGMVYNVTNQTMNVYTNSGWTPFAYVGGLPVVTNPSGNQTITQPINTIFNFITSGTGAIEINSNPILYNNYPNVATLNGVTTPNLIATSSGTNSSTIYKLNGPVYYVRNWCTTPGTLNDTCFSNAIADAVTNGYVGFAGHKYATLIVSPEIYVFSNQITVPAGLNISIQGQMQSGVYGSTININGSNGFLVQSDNIDINHISFLETSGTNTGITLGTSSIVVYDSHINWCWFAGVQVGIHIVSASGLDLSHNTFDAGSNYGIYSNYSSGDANAQDIQALDLRGYGQISTVDIIGNSGTAYSNYRISGIFDYSQSGAAPVALTNVIGATITGEFNNNYTYDVSLSSSTGVTVGPFVSYNSGQGVVSATGGSGIIVSHGSIVNTGVKVGAGTGSSISFTGVTYGSVTNVTSRSIGIANNLYGLSVDATSTGTQISGNAFTAQTGSAYNVLDTTAQTTIVGKLNSTNLFLATSPVTFTSIASGLTSVVCTSGYSCTSKFGIITVVSTTYTGGTAAFTAVWPATTNASGTAIAQSCIFSQFLGTAWYGWATTAAPTSTGFTVYTSQTLASTTTYLQYFCQPNS